MRNILKSIFEKVDWKAVGLTVAGGLAAFATSVITSKQIELEVDEKFNEKFSEAQTDGEETEDEEEP